VLGQYGGERSTSQLNDFQCTDYPAGVARKDARCGQRIGIAQPLVELLRTLRDELALQSSSHRRVCSRELEVVDNRSDVQGGSADQNWDDVTSPAVVDRASSQLLEFRHRRGFGDV
jgi:hypothetical protein